ncbi:hypothetical protein [Paenibacillus polymyxa]|uniref:hypothetical protein n=1 Tax=Paenibacillus polymyxa TaxID=1406 RepID=UPI002AB4B3AA|nr:hypothetical protein [Paenibacillus polymyxa]MDY8021205.1 hypothetical protein [Paenibacillus polymyxa]
MAVYKVLYKRESEYVMEVEAESEEEAMKKYHDYNCLDNYETQGLSEEVISVKKK